MHQNHSIYKGFRLTAKVARGLQSTGHIEKPSGPVFTAVVEVVPASLQHEDADTYPIPCFVDGGFVYSPAEAVHAAVSHGREIVDALTGFPAR
ncbi:hypothetical protein CAL29_21520 [Bordetella genomosp. 10]|uniref:Uncharacterized protein n=1 Tax=Bordetella genomosp. 10 TaxID=1416804 RepID=A0A261S0Q0_9BORD|nr:hypothetical protein [Bordetella genomosp. 10]OZI30587.1 hypothetical protein CAL29_21520 [Bordetella genomosp. 10]